MYFSCPFVLPQKKLMANPRVHEPACAQGRARWAPPSCTARPRGQKGRASHIRMIKALSWAGGGARVSDGERKGVRGNTILHHMPGVNPPDPNDQHSWIGRAYHLAPRALAERAGVPHPQGVVHPVRQQHLRFRFGRILLITRTCKP